MRAILHWLHWNFDCYTSLNPVIWKSNSFLILAHVQFSQALPHWEVLEVHMIVILCWQYILDETWDLSFGYQIATWVHPRHKVVDCHIRKWVSKVAQRPSVANQFLQQFVEMFLQVTRMKKIYSVSPWGYSQQSPNKLKVVWRVSLNIKITHWILDWAGSEGRPCADAISPLSE